MTNNVLVKSIQEYCITELYELEVLMNKSIVQFKTNELAKNSYNDNEYLYDEIEITLHEVNLFELGINYQLEDYADYSLCFNKDYKKNILHKINYNDFQDFENDFIEITLEKLTELEEKILEQIDVFITNNFDTPENTKHLINKILINKIIDAYLKLVSNTNDTGYIVSYLPDGGYNKLITDTMSAITIKQDDFINLINTKFEFYTKKRQANSNSKIEIESKKEESNIPHFFKEKKTYLKFQEYCSNLIIHQYTDYSYLLKRLMKENLIHGITDKMFLKWLIDNDMIDDYGQKLFFENNQFKSFSNCHSKNRMKNFNFIFDL